MMPPGFPGLPAGWKTETETAPSVDGKVQLFTQTLSAPVASTGRTLVVMHGMGEHGGRYLHVPHYLQGTVDAVVCLDHRGHGRSEGLRGHVERFDDLIDDAASVVRRVAEKRGDKVHLLGHSLGGHIAIRMQLLHPALPLASVTASAPFLGIKQHVPAVKLIGGRVLANVWGTLQLDTELDVDRVSHDRAVVETYKKDRLTHTKMTTRFFVNLVEAMKDTLTRVEGIRPPLQVLVPLDDRIVDPELSQDWYRRLKHPDKRMKTYPGFFHEPMHEVGKEQVFADIVEWIGGHA